VHGSVRGLTRVKSSEGRLRLDSRNRMFASPRSRWLGVSLLAVAGMAAFAAVGSSGGFRQTLAKGMASAGSADPRWLLAAFGAFFVSLAATAGGWRSTLIACGGRLGRADACARYGAGSLVNILLPARLGEALRVGLFSKAFGCEQSGRTLMTMGALSAVTVADTLTQSLVVGAGAGIGPVPAWSLAVLGGFVVGAAGTAVLAAKRFRAGRPARLLGVFQTLSDSPARAARLFGWLGAATVARLVAAIAIAASLGIPNPVEAGVVMCAVVIVATALPLTPGNVGVTSGAIVLALQAQGVPVASAVAAGLVFHAVELLAGIVFGVAGALALVPYPSMTVRRWSLAVTGLLGTALLAASVGTAFISQLT
jgi:glycosyltransferase 2 family protein